MEFGIKMLLIKILIADKRPENFMYKNFLENSTVLANIAILTSFKQLPNFPFALDTCCKCC